MGTNAASRMAAGLGIITLGWFASCGGAGTEEAGTKAPDVDAVKTPDAHVVKLETAREIVTRDGAFRVEWMPVGGLVPVNEHFEVEVTITRTDDAKTPVEGAEVAMTCFMPEHGHGMLREPRAEEVGKGVYLVKGMLLHMDGYWTVSVNVNLNGLAATADDELRL